MAEKVLIVDDDTRLSAMLADYLSGNGYTVHTAATGGAGLRELSRLAPDAVILDVMLPDIDGFETCRRIRASHRTENCGDPRGAGCRRPLGWVRAPSAAARLTEL